MPDFETFKRWVTADWRAHKAWRDGARDDFRFVAGDQWTDEEKQELEEQSRPPIVFNRTATIINSVVGSEINNRTEVRFMPRTLGDAEVNELLTKGSEWFRDQAGAEEEDSQAFADAVTCGLGWAETLMDFESDSEGEPGMERINPLEMFWDSSAEKRGLTDCHRIGRIRKISLDEAMEQWPDADRADLDASWLDEKGEGSDQPHVQHSDDDYNYHDDDDDDEREIETVTIVQLQYRVRIREVEYVDPQTRERQVMGKAEYAKFIKTLKAKGFVPLFTTRDIVRFEWKQVVMGNVILEENQPCRDKPTFTPITAYWDNEKRQWYGLLRQMKDPQKFANKWLSQTLHIINSNSKGGVYVEDTAVDDIEDFEERYSAADGVIRVRDGTLANGKIQPKPQPQMPTALMSLTEFAISSIRDVSGVNQELLGMRDQNQPGILEYQRKQAAMTTLAVLFDALRQYRKQQAEVMLFYMVEYLADGRLIRISDEDGERYEPLVIDPGVRKYDVIVDDSPTAPNNKERVWETIQQMLPILERAGLSPEIWAEIIEYSPFPSALVEKLRDFATKPQEPDPEAEKMKELALQAAMAEVEKLRAEIDESRAEAERERANAYENWAQGNLALVKAGMAPLESLAEMQKDGAQAQLAQAKLGHDGTKAQLDYLAKMAALNGQRQN
jgi:hypothetical protein